VWWALCKGRVQLWYALWVSFGSVIAIVRLVMLSRCGGAGFLRGVGNYGRYQPGFMYHEHDWVAGKRYYVKTFSRFTQPWYASRLAMSGMIAVVARVVFSRGTDVGSLGRKVNHCRCQPDTKYRVHYWTARGYLVLHASNLQSFGMHCGCNRSKWLGETTFEG